MLKDVKGEPMTLGGNLLHRWRLEHHQFPRHKVNVTTPIGMTGLWHPFDFSEPELY